MRNRVPFVLPLVFVGNLLAQTTQPVAVPGTSDPWLAGMPSGSSASCGAEGCDFAPAESSPGIAVTAGSTLSITATGLECYDPTPSCATGPDGNPSLVITHSDGAQNGMSTITAPANALLGVFLGPSQPSLMPPPTQLGPNAAPVLQQVFIIGSTSTVTVPAGATRLFFGPMDGYGWYDNYGSFTVTITPGCQVNVSPISQFTGSPGSWGETHMTI